MFKLRLTMDCQPRSKNGSPPQSTTGAASRNCHQTMLRPLFISAETIPGTISDIEIKTSGIEKSKLNQNLRLMSTSS